MQMLFFMWNKEGALVRVEILERSDGVDVNATAHSLMRMRPLWDNTGERVARCTAYLVDDCRLALVDDEEEDED